MVLNGIHRQYLQTTREVRTSIPLGGAASQIKLVLILEKKGGRASNSWQRMVRQGPQYSERSMVVFALKGRTAS